MRPLQQAVVSVVLMFLLAEEAEAVALSTMRLLVMRALLFAGVIGLCIVNAAPVVLIALIVLLAEACQHFWSKATAAPVMLVLLPGDVLWCS